MEEKKEYSSIITAIILIIISIIFFNIISSKLNYEKTEENIKYYKAKVLETKTKKVKTQIPLDNMNGDQKEIEVEEFKALIKDEDLKGKEVEGQKEPTEFKGVKDDKLKKGDKIIIVKSAIDGDESFHYVSKNYSAKLAVLIIMFVLGVILIAKTKGFKTISLLFLIGYAIFKTYIPAIICGYNIYLTTILLAFYSITIGIIIINGLNKKSYSAILGNLVGISLAGVLGIITNNIFNMTGITSEESMLLIRTENHTFDLRGIAWAGILIGALGAIMDTGLSISSSIREISKTTKTTDFKELFKSGMEVGKDAISTMISTLLLAYISGTLIQTLLMNIYVKPMKFLLNSEFILEEVIKAAIGAIGILITVPVTAAFASLFEVMENKKEKDIYKK